MCSLPPASKKKLIRKSSISKEPRINMESEDDSDYYNKAILYNDDLKGLDGDGSDDDKDKTDHCVPDERSQPVSERTDRQASLHLLQKRDD